VRTELFKQMGGFDEHFFVYYEEVDFTKRVSELGYKTYYNADLKVIHQGGGSTQKVKGLRLYYLSHSKLIYIRKHFGFPQHLVEPISRIVFSLFKGTFSDIRNILKGYSLLYKKVLFDLPR
ncbi:MAG: glycosyltransferase family 2 protein, partial [Gammaproteobacteria bacterium]